jgi:hypothetical protein
MERVAKARGGARAIGRVNPLLPERDLARFSVAVAKQVLQAFRPGELARFYIPNPNSIIRSPRNERRILRALSRAVRRSFMAVD